MPFAALLGVSALGFMGCSGADDEGATSGGNGGSGGAHAAGRGGSGGGGGPLGGAGGAGGQAAGGSAAGGSAAGGAGGSGGSCPLGTFCNPIVIDSFPYNHQADTSESLTRDIDRYSCAPEIDESGPELVYSVVLAEAGTLTARVTDEDGVDVDLHLLDAPTEAACLTRGDTEVRQTLAAGEYFLVADTWVTGAGQELPGPYQLDVSFIPTSAGGCATYPLDLRMVWASCDASLDCFEAVDPDDGVLARFLRTPAVGPVVKEAHLVTTLESFPAGWPTSFTDQIARHYELSQGVSGYVMNRTEPWAPAGEGGSRFGQGSTSVPIPADAEAWYVNMYWRRRPAAGTRMIVRNPANGRAVVAAAGYETGPGSNTAIGGVAEEVHHYLGTSHRGELELGFAVDDTLAYGPIHCDGAAP